MTDHGQITARRSAPSSARLEEAINHLSLGIVIFDEKREVVFCNERYREMYGLSPEQVKPGTPTSELIRHRLDLGLRCRWRQVTSASASPATSHSTPPCSSSLTAGSSPTPSTRCPAAAGWRPEDISVKRSMPGEAIIRTRQEQEETLRVRNFQFDTAINNMSQGCASSIPTTA